MGNPVVHFEVIGADGPALEKFYGELFGWHIQSMPEMSYGLVDTHAGEGINGGIGSAQEGSHFVTVYIEVSDLEAALKKVEKLGAKRQMDPMEVPGVVALAQFTDPQGNLIGIVRGGEDGSEGGVSPGDGVAVGWFEILGSDGPALRDFYAKAFGWSFEVAAGPMDYGQVDTKSKGRGIPGGVGKSQEEPVVTVYAGVDDLQKYLDRAEGLGASTAMKPMDVGEGTTIAAFRDPQGNLFGMYKHVHPH